MAERRPDAADDEDRLEEEEATLSDEEWPVAQQYRVQERSPRAEDDTIVVRQDTPLPYDSRRRFPPDLGPGLLAALAAVLLLLLLIPAGLWFAGRDDADETTATTTEQTTTDTGTTGTTPTQTTPAGKELPNVVGNRLAEARQTLEAAGFEVRFRRTDSVRPAGEVLRQEPGAGSEQSPATPVVLTVSGGPAGIAVPDVVGSNLQAARQTLRDAGLEPRSRRVPSDEPAGTVVVQDPAAGEEVEDGTVVVLDVARAKETKPAAVTVPRLIGTSASDARARLRQLGLRSRQRSVPSERPAGTVVGQTPRPGSELAQGGTVTLEVSSGPAKVEVPDTVGLDEASARAELESAGFRVQVVDEPTSEPSEDGAVLRQTPSGGTTAREGAVVTITVARFA